MWNGALLERFWEWTREKRGIATDFGGATMVRGSTASPSNRRGSGGQFEDIMSSLPAMECIPIQKGAVVVPELAFNAMSAAGEKSHNGNRATRLAARMNTTELEPTFLREQDYPAAWVVYHRVLGVVKKTEADEYDKNNKQNDLSSPEPEDEITEAGDQFGELEEKKDERLTTKNELDDEKTVHHSNVSSRRRADDSSTNPEESSSSSTTDNDNKQSADFPIMHSIAAGG